MMRALLPLIALLTAAEPGPGAGVVRGIVWSSHDASPVVAASVELLPAGRGTLTDPRGAYRFEQVSPGRHKIRLQHPGFEPQEIDVLVPWGGDVVLEVVLEVRPVALDPVTALGDALSTSMNSRGVRTSELGVSAVRTLEAAPGLAEMGLVGLVQDFTGRVPRDPSEALFVRGSDADLKLVLLDGAPVHAPFHLGGLVSAYQDDVLSGARLIAGGASARYDGGLSYILDLETRAGGDSLRATGSADLLSAEALVEGPLSPASRVLLAFRDLHALGTDLLLDVPFPYRYRDALARIDLELPDGSGLHATGFNNREAVNLGQLGGPEAQASWGNTAGSLRYRWRMGATVAQATAAFGKLEGALPIGGDEPATAVGRTRRSRFLAHFARALGALHFDWGAGYEHLGVEYTATQSTAGSDSLEVLLLAENTADAAAAYGNVSWEVVPVLEVRAGVRSELFELTRELRTAPRLAVRWLLTPQMVLTASAGRYHQYVRVPETQVAESFLLPGRLIAPIPLVVAESDQFVVELDQEPIEGLRVQVIGYHKLFRGVPRELRTASELSGLDLWVHRSGERVAGWVGYSPAWASVPRAGEEEEPLFIKRHLFSAGVVGRLGGSTVGISVAYGEGLPLSAVPTTPPPTGDAIGGGSVVGGESLPLPLPPSAVDSATAPTIPTEARYLRVDAELSHTWSGRVAGNDMQITPYLRVVNALDRRDAIFYRYDAQQSPALRPLAGLPVLPVVGLNWTF